MSTKIIIIIVLLGIITLTIYVIGESSKDNVALSTDDVSARLLVEDVEDVVDQPRVIAEPEVQVETNVVEKVEVFEVPDEVAVEVSEPSIAQGTLQSSSNADDTKVAYGKYIGYSKQAAVDAAESGDAVLFFHASWCPTCRGLDGKLKGSKLPDGLTILKVDYDSSSALKKKYGVRYQHTLVQVDENLDLIGTWSGSRNLNEILSELR